MSLKEAASASTDVKVNTPLQIPSFILISAESCVSCGSVKINPVDRFFRLQCPR